MTFLEAAIEVLRHETKALHFSEIAKAAVTRKLLSHVGRDPEAAMRSCLTSAVRGNHSEVISRTKPGHYIIRPGAVLPDPPPIPEPVNGSLSKKANDIEAKPAKSKAGGRTRRKAGDASTKTASRKTASKSDEAGEDANGAVATDEPPSRSKAAARRRGRGRQRSGAAEADASGDADDQSAETGTDERDAGAKMNDDGPDDDGAADEAPRERAEPRADSVSDDAETPVQLEFAAPAGAGLEGVTDVALVMANAMSRIVDERPELRGELEAMQAKRESEARARAHAVTRAPAATSRPAPSRPVQTVHVKSPSRRLDEPEERGGRRRRRRRRRSRKVDWTARAAGEAPGARVDDLLDRVATTLTDAGSRSLHVRQIAESLAEQDVLGGEISEIERAVTAALLADVGRFRRRSRFVARGDARYQLQASRLPKGAADAEEAFRDKTLALEAETRLQLINWVSSLGVRALESVVRIYLQRRDHSVLATLPPSRGLTKLVVDDNDDDDDDKTLVVVVPRKSALDLKAWQDDAGEHGCTQILVIAMGDVPDEAESNVRFVDALELGRWLFDNRVGVETVRLEVPMLDPAVIESIGGLDT